MAKYSVPVIVHMLSALTKTANFTPKVPYHVPATPASTNSNGWLRSAEHLARPQIHPIRVGAVRFPVAQLSPRAPKELMHLEGLKQPPAMWGVYPVTGHGVRSRVVRLRNDFQE